MRVFFWKRDKVVHRETDAMDIVTKKYVIRIRISGITLIRKARPKKNRPQRTIFDDSVDLTG